MGLGAEGEGAAGSQGKVAHEAQDQQIALGQDLTTRFGSDLLGETAVERAATGYIDPVSMPVAGHDAEPRACPLCVGIEAVAFAYTFGEGLGDAFGEDVVAVEQEAVATCLKLVYAKAGGERPECA